MSRVAEEAGADPALVRYYFGDRTVLMVAVIDGLTAHDVRDRSGDQEPIVAIADHIRKTVQFVRSAPFLHRLIVDELSQTGTAKSRARVRDMNLDLVAYYRELLSADDRREMVDADALFVHLAILGASDFFASAEPLIRDLVPDGTDMNQLAGDFETSWSSCSSRAA